MLGCKHVDTSMNSTIQQGTKEKYALVDKDRYKRIVSKLKGEATLGLGWASAKLDHGLSPARVWLGLVTGSTGRLPINPSYQA